MLLNDSLKKEINRVSVVSFDIFDTLLIRPYVKPTDLFLHMEKALHKPLFCVSRIAAERDARLANHYLEDITFDMIYNEIGDEFKNMKQKEMDWEKMVLRTNPELKQVYDYAKKKGKKIVIASDMYLPTDFLANVLRENGYEGWDKLYVSGDVNARKGNGTLFKKIIADFKIKPQNILHIGDNKTSDFKIPQKLNINSKHYRTIYKQYIKSHKGCEQLKAISNDSLGLSIILSVMAYKRIEKICGINKEKNYWKKLGYRYAGPVGYGYTRFIEKVVKDNGIKTLLFVARDGYLLQKIYNLLSSNIANAYIYAPRFLNNICRLDYVANNKHEAQAILEFYANKDSRVKKVLENSNNPQEAIQKNINLLKERANRQMEIYKKYLHHKIPNINKCALVDTITGAFSAQKMLQSALIQEIFGIYWGICSEQYINRYEHRSFVGLHHQTDAQYFTDNWNFMEFLITSPEYPIKNIDNEGNPIYAEKESEYEIKRSKLYPDIAEGALDFTKDVQTWFGGYDIYLSASDIVNWVNVYIEHPSKEDIKQMQNIRIGEDSSHQIWIPLFVDKVKLWDLIKFPRKTIKMLRETTWRTHLQSFLICLTKPLSIKIRGIKKISFILFPYLKKQYLKLVLNLGQKNIYQFVIGNGKSQK